METQLHEGLFVSDGHLIKFKLGNDELVWVDEAVPHDYGLACKLSPSDLTAYVDTEITTHIVELNDAMDFQKKLIDMGYNFFPDFNLTLLRESESEYIH
mgnify:CR=1 FL=1|jgi:hypothetical protein